VGLSVQNGDSSVCVFLYKMAIVLCVCLSAQNGGPGLELSAMSNIINFRLQECENPRDIIEQGTDIPKMNVFSCAITDTVCVCVGGSPFIFEKKCFRSSGMFG